jgi:hypothetical protein
VSLRLNVVLSSDFSLPFLWIWINRLNWWNFIDHVWSYKHETPVQGLKCLMNGCSFSLWSEEEKRSMLVH